MQTNPLNVFITGATTALGRAVTRRLVARGHRVTGLTPDSAHATLARQDGAIPAFITDPFRAGELKSLLRAAEADVVLHLTPQLVNGFPRRGLDWAQNDRALREGLPALHRAAIEAGVKFFVLPSYTFLYGDLHGEWADETTPRQESPLWAAALNAEDRVLDDALPACVIRAGTVYGPHEDGTETLIEALKRGRGVYTGDENALSAWIHVDDLAAALVLAAEVMPDNQLFNAADDMPASAAAFVGYLANNLGMPAPGAPPAFLRRALTDEMQQARLTASHRIRSEKLKTALGWTPRHANYRAGIDHTLLIARAESAQR
ncbi:MAG: NAD-dependent epimerase/dehydratase family protein [Chloroflexi bacterium]|nr:NAD-dependent epimerase/dehydratase family protein [Chloroflexota bacterium]